MISLLFNNLVIEKYLSYMFLFSNFISYKSFLAFDILTKELFISLYATIYSSQVHPSNSLSFITNETLNFHCNFVDFLQSAHEKT